MIIKIFKFEVSRVLEPVLIRADEEIVKVLKLKFHRVLIIAVQQITIFTSFIFRMALILLERRVDATFALIQVVHDVFLNYISNKFLRIILEQLLFGMDNGFIILNINYRLLRHELHWHMCFGLVSLEIVLINFVISKYLGIAELVAIQQCLLMFNFINQCLLMYLELNSAFLVEF